MGRSTVFLLPVIMFCGLICLACQEVSPPGDRTADCGTADMLCVGLVTDVGSVKDKSFNQSSWDGVRKAVLSEGLAEFIETRDAKDYAANIALFVNNGYDIIVTVGFGLGEATREAARRYPEVQFIGVDQFQGQELANLTGLVFHENQAGFLAGALAAMLSNSGIIAAVLATDLVPPVVAFKEGFEAGARYVNADIQVISTFHPGGLDVAFTDPEWGAVTAKQAMDQNADVIFAAGGTTGNGGLIEVATRKGAFCIGVDTDQWETVPEARSCLVTSATKQISAGVSTLIEMAREGRFPGGNYFGDVALAPFHDFESDISQEIKDQLVTIERGVKGGTIRISDY